MPYWSIFSHKLRPEWLRWSTEEKRWNMRKNYVYTAYKHFSAHLYGKMTDDKLSFRGFVVHHSGLNFFLVISIKHKHSWIWFFYSMDQKQENLKKVAKIHWTITVSLNFIQWSNSLNPNENWKKSHPPVSNGRY